MSKAKKPFQPQNFKEVVMPFSQSVYMTVVVLNGDTVRARGREAAVVAAESISWQTFQKQFPLYETFKAYRWMYQPTVCVCVWGGGPPSFPQNAFPLFDTTWGNL